MAELIDDNALLGADDDELDYDLEKDEEDALLADPDTENFDENYEENQILDDPNYGNEEDVLDIDSNVRLDETEEDLREQNLQENKVEESQATLQEEDDDDFEEQKQRNRFNSERNQNQAIHRLTSNEIPDSLEKVAVQPFNNPNNYQRNNGRFHRGRGRGRGRNFNPNNGNNNRPSVFGRVGNIPIQMENKKVLINPHFRGNVQVNENARLVWDPNSNAQHQRFQNNQVIPVAPFQANPSPWVVAPFSEQNNGFNQPQMQHNYHEQPPMQYNNPGQDLRPLMQINNNQFGQQNQPIANWSEDTTTYNSEIYQTQGNFRGREVRQQNPQQLLINQQNFNQQHQRNFIQIPQQRPPLLNQPNIPPLLPIPNQQFDQPPNNNQFINQQFPQQTQFQQFPPQQFNQQQQQNQPVYDYDNQFHQQNYNYNYKAPPQLQQQHQHHQQQHQPHQHQHQQHQQHHVGYQPQPVQPQEFQQYDNNRPFNRNTQQRGNNRNFNPINRTPPKRRTFEQKVNLNSGDLPKKKRRSLELSNLHEVPTVDMPDTTTEDKGEEEDEETKAYRKKIEEQKKLREKILQQKEERRKIAAASKQTINQQSNTVATIKQQPLKQPQKKVVAVKNQQQKNLIVQRRMNQQQQQPPTNIIISQKQPQPQRIVMMKQPQPNLQTTSTSTNTLSNPNRRVVLKGLNNKEILTTIAASNSDEKNPDSDTNLSSFLSNRKVIANTTTMGSGTGATDNNKSVNLNEGLIQTPIVVVSNLAASTTDVKIRSMCQGLGPIQTIEMIPNSRQATITFKNVLSAHKFFKKFQRKIVDLSMIQVTLEDLT